jgi:hypothetical protein
VIIMHVLVYCLTISWQMKIYYKWLRSHYWHQ